MKTKDFKFGRGSKNYQMIGGGEMFHQLSETILFSGSTVTHFTGIHTFRPNIINRETLGDFAEHFDRICEYVGDCIQMNSMESLHNQHGTFSILEMSLPGLGHYDERYPTYRVEVRHQPRRWGNRWIKATISVNNSAGVNYMEFYVDGSVIEQENLPL